MNSIRSAVLVVFLLGLPRLVYAQSANLRVTASAGYDDDVLGRPGDPRSLASIGGEGFLQLSPSLDGSARLGPWFLGGAYRYTFNGYGSNAAGLYQDHLGSLSIRYQRDPRMTLIADGSAERFRRTEYKDSDVDAYDAGARLEYNVARGWTAESAFYAGWKVFPERVVGSYLQNDTVTELEGGVSRAFGYDRRLRLNLSRLSNTSNESTSRYDGWKGQLTAQARAWQFMDLVVRVIYENRAYDENPLPGAAAGFPGSAGFAREGAVDNQSAASARAAATPPSARPGAARPEAVVAASSPRRDHYSQISISLGRQLTPRLRSFAKAGQMNYRSTADGYSFSEATASAGIEFTLGRPDRLPPRVPFIEPEPQRDSVDLAPRVRGREVRFLHQARGARSVAVIGNFNNWQAPGLAMSDTGKDGVWQVVAVLPPGLYHYMFLVDGTIWQRPAKAPLYEADGFGFDNGVLEIGE